MELFSAKQWLYRISADRASGFLFAALCLRFCHGRTNSVERLNLV